MNRLTWTCLVLLAAAVWAEPVKFPVHQPLHGKVKLDIELAQTPGKSQPGWCYRTRGLKPDEMMIMVLRGPQERDEDYPREPIALLRTFAAKGTSSLYLGEVADFGGRPFLKPGFSGFLLVEGEPLKGVVGSETAISVVPLFPTEMEVADLTGPSRVIGGLANQSRYYPCPVWCDPGRKPVFTAADVKKMKEDITLRTYQYHSDAGAIISGDSLHMLVSQKTAAKLADILTAQRKVGLRIALAVDPRADAFMIWTPDESPQAVSMPGSKGQKMGVQSLCVLVDQKQSVCKPLGDGAALVLTAKDYDRLLRGLRKEAKFTLTVGGQDLKKVVVERPVTDYKDPVTGAVYRTTRGMWTKYAPEHKASPGLMDMEVVLLTNQKRIGDNVEVETLGNYIKQLGKVCEGHLIALRGKQKVEVALLCELQPGRAAKYRAASKTVTPPKSIATKFYAALAKIKTPPVKGEVKFELILRIKPI